MLTENVHSWFGSLAKNDEILESSWICFSNQCDFSSFALVHALLMAACRHTCRSSHSCKHTHTCISPWHMHERAHTQHANAHAHLCCTRALTCTAMSPMCPAYASCVHTWVSASPSPSQVMKKDGQLLMTGKAYNNRCIAEWLHDAALRANQVSTDPRMPVACLLMTLALILGVGMFETIFPGSLPVHVRFLCVFKCFSPIPFWRRVRYHLAKEWHHSIFWDHGKISPVLATGSARNSTCRHGVVVWNFSHIHACLAISK